MLKSLGEFVGTDRIVTFHQNLLTKWCAITAPYIPFPTQTGSSELVLVRLFHFSQVADNNSALITL